MYPLNVMKPGPVAGFAVASDAAEHAALTAAGYLPALVVASDADKDAGVHDQQPTDSLGQHTLESARAALDAAGIAYDKRLGLARLIELLP